MKPIAPELIVAGAVVCALGAAYQASAPRLRAESPAKRPAAVPVADPARLAGEPAAQNQEAAARTVKMTARRYRFDPPRIEVFVDDLVSIELRTEDIAHSLTIDAYRIAKRVAPGQPLTFEFRADQAGTFPIYCNLQIDDGCRQMRGELVVKRR